MLGAVTFDGFADCSADFIALQQGVSAYGFYGDFAAARGFIIERRFVPSVGCDEQRVCADYAVADDARRGYGYGFALALTYERARAFDGQFREIIELVYRDIR